MLKSSAALPQAAFNKRMKERGFSLNNKYVILRGFGLQSPRLLSREAKRTRLSQGGVLLSLF